MKKHFVLAITLVVCSLLIGTLAEAQTKKKLRTEVEDLTERNVLLTRENQDLKRTTQNLSVENQQLKQRNGQLESTVTELRKDSAIRAIDYQMLRKEYAKMKQDGGGSQGEAGRPIASVNIPKEDCGLDASRLTPGNTYTLNMGKLNSNGWGVQVYSFSSLCAAKAKAEEFSKYYQMFKTYIRVKEVNNQRVYSVIYGSLRDEQQARVYVENFRKIAKDEAGKNAFLVQH